jgi:hypothetical protein
LAFHLGCEADHSPPSSAEVKEWVELCLHSPNMPSWCGAWLGGAQGQLYLFLCTFCRIKKIINCLSFLNSPHSCSHCNIIYLSIPMMNIEYLSH